MNRWFNCMTKRVNPSTLSPVFPYVGDSDRPLLPQATRTSVQEYTLMGWLHLTASQSYEYDWLPKIYWLTWKSIHGEIQKNRRWNLKESSVESERSDGGIWKKRRWNLKEATVKIGVITVKAANNIIDRKISVISPGKVHCPYLLSRGFLPMDLLQNLNPPHIVKLYACSH